MRYGPNQDPPLTIVIEFDYRNGRKSRTFDDVYEARTFYASKFEEGRNPSLKAEEIEMAKKTTGSKRTSKPTTQPETAPEVATVSEAEAQAPATETKATAATTAAQEVTGPAGIKNKLNKLQTNYVAAAKVIAKHGLEVGVTDEMASEFKEQTGETKAWLIDAWHTINAYHQATEN